MFRFVCTVFVGSACVSAAAVAHAGGLAESASWGASTFDPPATIRAHQYTLEECLALADRNFPNLWAARARLATAHAQLEEAIWTPWFQWSAQSSFGVAP